jgi:hypothetical protein
MRFRTSQQHRKPGIDRRFVVCFLLFAFAWTLAPASDRNVGLVPLTNIEADTIIAQQMENKAAGKAARKAELEAIPAIAIRVIEKDGHRVTMNRVAPPAQGIVSASVPRESNDLRPLTPDEVEALIAAQPEHQSITLSVTVFDEGYSKVLWRQPRDDDEPSKAPHEFELWTNLNLNYLSPISSFERDDVVYNYVGFGETITHVGEARRSAFAQEHGYDYESRWQEPPVNFTAGQPEYVVVANSSRPIPPELYQQMDALFAHYLENEGALKAEHLRNEALREAKDA